MTGKTKEINLGNRTLLFHNQRCKEWTHPYPYQEEGNLANSGCGIFALCHASQWLTGAAPMRKPWQISLCEKAAVEMTVPTGRPFCRR